MDTHTPTPLERIFRNTILYALGFILVGIVGRFGLALVAIFGAILLAFAGPVYVITVLIVTARKRKAERAILASMNNSDKQQFTTYPAYQFAARTQIHTFATNILLTISSIGGIILGSVIGATNNSQDIQDVLLWGLGTALVVQTILTVIINTELVYNTSLRLTEQYALQTRTGAWKLILINRIWSWGIWTVGALMGVTGAVFFTQVYTIWG
jgi:hypothetical protein